MKFWVALGLNPFDAVTVKGNTPPTAGLPERVAVPLPLSLKVTPEGNGPVSDSAAAGVPAVVTVKLPVAPSVNVVDDALVIEGGPLTVRVKFCVAFGEMPLAAWMVMG